MIEIPLQKVPNQELQIILNGQNCALHVYWRFGKLYCDLMVNNEQVFTGCMIQDCQLINQSPSLLFSGGLIMVDTLGDATPCWDELDSRWVLVYLTNEEINDLDNTVASILER